MAAERVAAAHGVSMKPLMLTPGVPVLPLVLRPDVYEDAAKQVAVYARVGYSLVPRHQQYRTGSRVNTRSRTYYGARAHGIGVVLAIGHASNSYWSQKLRAPDVEVLVLRWDGQTVSSFANYPLEPCIEDVLAAA